MNQKVILILILTIILSVTALALYYSGVLTGEKSLSNRTTTPATSPTAELESVATQNDLDLTELDKTQTDFEAVDVTQDNVGL